MKKLLALTMTALAISACTDWDGDNRSSPASLAPGKYEKTTTSTNAQGTTTKQRTETNVTVDQYGRKTAVVESESTKDPKGLFNKSTSETKKVYQER